jgi:hypothetical protein
VIHLRSAFLVGLVSLFAVGSARGAEWRQLATDAAGLYSGGASAVSDDGSAVFGYADVAPGGDPSTHTPVRWLRQPDGSFVPDALGEGATILDLPRGTAVDVAADGSAAALRGLPKWTEAAGITCGPFCPPEGENSAITADGAFVAASSFSTAPPGKRVLLWSDAGIDVIDQVDPSFVNQLNVWDVSADGTVAVGEYPGPNGVQPVVWTRNGPQSWTRTLPGLPPGAGVARAYRVSDDGQHVLVQWSPTDYTNLGFGTLLWSADAGYEDISAGSCRPDAIGAQGSVAVGRCGLYLGRWSRAYGWETFPTVSSFVVRDISPDGRYAVGGGCGETCARWADLGPVDSECRNGLDDDGDGLVDFGSSALNDPGCASTDDLSERSPTIPCDDGVDNDGDGFTDFPADPGCRSVTGMHESPSCEDGIDNDHDGFIDFDGGASLNGGVPLTDPDPQCIGKPWLNTEAPRSCGLGADLPLVFGALAWARRRHRTRR